MTKKILLSLLTSASLAQPLLAHHGDDFLVLEDAALPKPWHGYLSSSFDWENYSGADSFGAEPTVLFSIAPHLALSVAGSFNDEGDGWDYSSITPRLHVQITPPDSDFPIKVAFSVGYQFAGDSDGSAGHGHGAESASPGGHEHGSSQKKSSHDHSSQSHSHSATGSGTHDHSSHDHGDHDHGGGGDTPACDPLVDIDCAQAAQAKSAKAGRKGTKHGNGQQQSSSNHNQNHVTASSSQSSKKKDDCGCGGGSKHDHEAKEEDHGEGGHSHGGIHNHDANQWVGRLIVEADLGATKLLLNLIGNWPEGDSANFGYAVGVRHAFTHRYAAGVEAIGDFEDEGQHEILLGGYVSPNHSVTMKLGVGFGLTEASPDVTVRTGVVWRF
jgi:hypothetical protein